MDELILDLLREKPELIPLAYEWIEKHREMLSQIRTEKE